MKFKLTYKLLPIIAATLFLTACSGAAQTAGEANAAITQPQEGAQFALGEQVNVVTSVDHPAGAQSVALFANDQLIRLDELSAPMQFGEMFQGWIPLNPGTYALKVLFTSAEGAELLSNTINITVGTEFAEESIVQIDLTPSITPEIIPSVTPTPVAVAPMATADQDTNCRLGPSTQYQNIGTLFTAQSAPIVGRLADNSWWVIDLSTSTQNCWVWDELVTVTGDTSGVPVLTPPALPLVAPNPIAPDDDISCASLIDVTFSWEAVQGNVAGYIYEIQTGSSASGPFSDYADGQTNNTSAEQELVCGTANYYRWRVRAEGANGEDGPWSDWSLFRAGP